MKRIMTCLMSVMMLFCGTFQKVNAYETCVDEKELNTLSTEEKAYYESEIASYLINDMLLNNAAVVGALANINAESGFNPNALGDNGTSYGICQWHDSRWDNLKEYCNNNGYDWHELDGQLHFLEFELKQRKRTYDFLTHTSNTYEGALFATAFWCRVFERPANLDAQISGRQAAVKNTFWKRYGNGHNARVDSNNPWHYYEGVPERIFEYRSPLMAGCDVMWVQQALNVTISAGLTLDGEYGTYDMPKVKEFQTLNGLTPTGVVDGATIGKLVERLHELGIYENVVSDSLVTYAPYNGVDYTNQSLSVERVAALDAAKRMVTIQWTAIEDFVTWCSSGGEYNDTTSIDGITSTKFLAGKTYTGIPYSMKDHSYSESKWIDAVINNRITTSFMQDAFYSHGKLTTAHGTDCSYFVYLAIAEAVGYDRISYQTTSYMKTSGHYSKLNSYDDAIGGDVFINDGHVRLYVGKTGDDYAVFECTAYGSRCVYNVYSKEQLESNGYEAYSFAGWAGSEVCHCTEDYAGNYLVTTNSSPLTIRAGHGTVFAKIGEIPKGDTCYVSKADGTWAHVSYNGINGYASMQYLQKVGVVVEEDSRYRTPFDYRYQGKRMTCYQEINGTAKGYIDPGDDCTVNNVYTNGWIYVTYPTANGTLTRYAKLDEFLGGYTNPTNVVADKQMDVFYDSLRTTKRGWIDPGDLITLLREENGSQMVLYPGTNNIIKCAWVKAENVAESKCSLDFYGELDGYHSESIAEYGTFDVYINEQLVADDVNDFHGEYPVGTTYEVKDITPTEGKEYIGCISGRLSGSLQVPSISITLSFKTMEVEVESVILDKIELNMMEGDVETLHATVLPDNAINKSITWMSSDFTVVDVDDFGKVTAVRAGTATISAFTNNGKLATCSVRVDEEKKYVHITRQPEDIIGKANATKHITVMAIGDDLSYQWYFKTLGTTTWKKSGLPGYNTGSLAVVLTSTNAARTYKCVITDKYGMSVETCEVNARIATLSITVNPGSIIGTSGETLHLHAEAASSEGTSVHYQWQFKKKGTESWFNSGYDGNKTDTLSVVVNSINAERYFRCMVKDDYGNAVYTNAVEVTIMASLVITRQPVDAVGKSGSTISVSMSATGDDLKYQWFFLASGSAEWRKSGFTGYNTNTIQIPVNSTNAKRLFKCVVTDRYGHSLETNAITVSIAKITITQQPKNVGGQSGVTVKAEVCATGNGLQYQWQFRKKGTTSWIKSGFAGNNTKTLSIIINATNINREFRCIIKDAYGNTETTNEIMAFVSDISIIKQPSDMYGANGEIVKADVTARGNNLRYQWYFMNDGTEKWIKSGFTGNATKTMSIPVNSTTMKRSFKCVITDEYGVILESNTIRVKLRTIKLITQPNDIVSVMYALEEATVIAQGNGLRYQWYFKTLGTDSWNPSGYAGNKSQTLEIPINTTSLNREFKCVITDAVGCSIETRSIFVRLESETNNFLLPSKIYE